MRATKKIAKRLKDLSLDLESKKILGLEEHWPPKFKR